MADALTRQVIGDLSGGRNGFDPAWDIRDNQCVEAINVDFYKTRFANKRGGLAAIATTGATTTGIISSLFRHVPGADETLAEFWSVDDSATPIINRLAAGTTWVAPTLKDAPTGNGFDFTAATVNGLLSLAYKSGQARHHVWDGSTVRRAGLASMAVPTVGDTGGGAYAAILRYYRTRATVQVGGVTVRRSEPSTAASFTPIGTGTAARVTQGAPPGEGETHWEVEASVDNATFYRIATVVIGTTTYDDSAATTSYPANPLSALTGVYTLPKPYKFVAGDQNRHLGLSSWTATDKQSRIEISAVAGSLDIGDVERIDTSALNYFIDLDESDSGIATGLAGPIFGAYFAFKERQVWQLTPTGSTAGPYRQDAISKSIGALHHLAIARGEDAFGNPALYWTSHRGFYRWSVSGLEYIGRNMEDYVIGPTATINLAATKAVARTIYYADKRQVWFWIATGASNDPNQLFLYDVITSGWTRVPTGDKLANVRCAVPFSNTIAAAMSRDLKPYVGQIGANNLILKADTGTTDNGTTYQAYVITKATEPGGPGFVGEIGDCDLLAKAGAGVTITDTITGDFGLTGQLSSGTALLTPTDTETRVLRRLEGTALSNIAFVQHQIGDAAAVSNAWTLDRVIVPYTKKAART